MIIQNKKILASILFVLISVVCHAQKFSGGAEMPQPRAAGPPNPPGLPIDEGLVFLFIAAVVYGVYKSLKLLKKQTQA